MKGGEGERWYHLEYKKIQFESSVIRASGERCFVMFEELRGNVTNDIMDSSISRQRGSHFFGKERRGHFKDEEKVGRALSMAG